MDKAVTKYHSIPNFSPLEIYSTTAEFVKAVGKRYGNKQFSDEANKLPGEGETTGGAAATASGAGGTAKASGDAKQSSAAATGKSGGFGVLDMDAHYAECYPGGMEEYDATYDSDEDVDFSKMDMVSNTMWCCSWLQITPKMK